MDPPPETWSEEPYSDIDHIDINRVRKPRTPGQIRALEKAKLASAKGREERRRALFVTFVDEKQELLKQEIFSEVEKRIGEKLTPLAELKSQIEKSSKGSHDALTVKEESKPSQTVPAPAPAEAAKIVPPKNKFAKYF